MWTRWGRVGEGGQSALAGAMAEAAAVKAFKAKFKAKTANEWDDRADFEPQGGKYDIVDVEEVRHAALPQLRVCNWPPPSQILVQHMALVPVSCT